ncbi:MAG: hypothetical protein H0W58_13925 [Acidobacteria bacterium]|jgi:hypothetical protein|nr:hypothetical protein [Acidobacteriota bacterium]
MKKDIRKQTFSKPTKPSDEEIKKLTADENILPTEPETKVSAKTPRKKGTSAVKKVDTKAVTGNEEQIENSDVDSLNPFLLSRGQTSEIRIEKTGYRLRADYMDLLKLVKRMKKGYTLEAVLDDALTFYFENSEDGQTAVKHQQVLDSIEIT